jgi:uncharacterized SAM-binding protein YcdF (DUF218 family)
MLSRRVVLSAAAALFVAWLAASGVLFLWPHEDSPRRADAVVVLAGGKVARLGKALDLMRRHVAPVLVISDGRDPLWPQANRLCDGHAPFTVLCFYPHPYSTQGEAETVARMGSASGWRSIVVVTSRYHVTRARILFQRCFHGDVETVGAPFPVLRTPAFVVSEWGKLLYELTIDRRC